MADAVQRSCEEFARRGELVIMAGAGVSAGPPSKVPSWYPLNAAIFKALRRRLEAGIDRPGWLEQVEPDVAGAREAGRFPPDYQAQLIEEMCGERYFQGLQALDITASNAAHEAIAALAAGGALRAVVTTNFDRLIERALERRGVPFAPAFDEEGFAAAGDGRNGALTVIKVHGSVTSAASMVDTWKQRRVGRSQVLTDLLAPLHDAFWVYAGFSAADLDDDDSYLGFLAGAQRSPGAVYIRFPGDERPLGPGAQKLMVAYAEGGDAPVVDVDEYLRGLGAAIGAPPATAVMESGPGGLAEIEAGLDRWADALSVSAAGLCVAAILEAVGAGETAVRVLDRLVRKELYDERDTPDFRALQLQYGRLGGALGRFVGVPDMQGAASNASVESAQSLMRITDSDAGFLARAWLAPMFLWLGDGDRAGALAAAIIEGFAQDRWDGPQPRSAVEVVDAWTCAAHVLVFNSSADTILAIAASAETAIDRAAAIGDVVREARLAAFHLLVVAESDVDVAALAQSYDRVFTSAYRVSDPVAFGLRALALARWLIIRSLAADSPGRPKAAQDALTLLEHAGSYFAALGMDPWLLFVEIHRFEAMALLGMVDDVNERINSIPPRLDRFPVLASFFFEAVAQCQQMVGDGDAATNFAHAVETALESGLRARHQRLAAMIGSQQTG